MTLREMEPGIHWLTSFDEALKQARQQDKPALLDFFSPT
jgi:hypothetical protein